MERLEVARGREEVVQVCAHRRRARPTEHVLGGRVPVGDATLGIHHHDGVLGRVGDGPHARLALPGQGHGQVRAHHHQHGNDPPRGQRHGRVGRLPIHGFDGDGRRRKQQRPDQHQAAPRTLAHPVRPGGSQFHRSRGMRHGRRPHDHRNEPGSIERRRIERDFQKAEPQVENVGDGHGRDSREEQSQHRRMEVADEQRSQRHCQEHDVRDRIGEHHGQVQR